MKKIIFFLSIVLASCGTTPGVDGSEFLGKWKMSESSPNYSQDADKISIEISKKDIFFWVSIKVNGKDMFDEIASSEMSSDGKRFLNDSHKYQLSPDKQSLISIYGKIEDAIVYHDDNKTIQSTMGWFKKE